jgi:nucleoside-diphosphate-sugar epimerase
MKVLVTGATGFVGRRLCPALVADGHNVLAVHRPSGVSPGQVAGVRWIAVDLAEPNFRLPLQDSEALDAVVSLAQSRHFRDFPVHAEDVFQINTAATLKLLEYGRTHGLRRFVHASTANVYAPGRRALTEDAPLGPNSFYAVSKRSAEMLVEPYGAYFGAVVLRLFTVYGPGQVGMLIPGLIERVRSGQAIRVQGQRGLPLSPIFVDDVTAAIRGVLVSPSRAQGFDVFNCGGREALTIRDIGDAIGRALGAEVRFEHARGDEPSGWWADSSRLANTHCVAPPISFEDGIRLTLEGNGA